MSYANHPSANNPSPNPQPRKDNRAIIYGVLVAALLGTWGYIIYDKSKSNEQITQLQASYTNVDSARNALQDEYNGVLSRMDSLTGSNTELSGKLSERQAEIEKLKLEIKSELKKKNGDLSRAKSLIAQLQTKVTDLLAEVERLQGENQTLTVNNQQLTAERDTLTVVKKSLEENLTNVQTEKAHVEDIASTLHASNINIAAIDVRNSGKEKATTTAKRADMLRVSFEIDENRISPSGSKELYVVITDPSGNVVSSPALGSGNFQTRDEGQKVYSTIKTVNYEQGKRAPVNVEWKQDSKFQTGNYKIQIYQNGFKIGEGVKSLKKGGIFG
jgi:peptidoglycan hydrolase CwlO-like protein